MSQEKCGRCGHPKSQHEGPMCVNCIGPGMDVLCEFEPPKAQELGLTSNPDRNELATVRRSWLAGVEEVNRLEAKIKDTTHELEGMRLSRDYNMLEKEKIEAENEKLRKAK